MTITDWTLDGYDGQTIYGNTHLPDSGQATGVLIICHGFKGYKDYGFFPLLAQSAAEHGLIAHRFNFSHSGMTNQIETFERPDLFSIDTWSKQVSDLQTVHQAVANGQLDGHGLPIGWYGHSRGGVTTMLAAGQGANDQRKPQPGAVITAAAPHEPVSLDDETRARLRQLGEILSPSARTGQDLVINRIWLDEIEADPAGHDVIASVKAITCPMLIIHGETDPTVPVDCAKLLKEAAGDKAELHVIAGAAHTFNCPNPLPLDATAPPETAKMITRCCEFAKTKLSR